MAKKRSTSRRVRSRKRVARAVVSGRSRKLPVKVARAMLRRGNPGRNRYVLLRGARRVIFRRLGPAVKEARRLAKYYETGFGIYSEKSGDRVRWIEAPKRNPSKARRRRNQEEDSELKDARRMFQKFHGKAAGKVEIVEQLRVLPGALADCGRMVELTLSGGPLKRLQFPENSRVRVGTTGNGGQLYFVKGDQSIPLAGIPHSGKDHVDLGVCRGIVYFTSKDFHNFDPSEYSHQFGEENGIRPTLHYDVRSKRLYLTGGDYQVRREGIVN